MLLLAQQQSNLDVDEVVDYKYMIARCEACLKVHVAHQVRAHVEACAKAAR